MSNDEEQEQLNEIKEAFDIFQVDAMMSVKDLKQAMRSLGYNTSDDEIEDIVIENDPENTGFLDFTKFLKIMEKKIRDFNSDKEIQEAFTVYDLDGNGFISASELRLVMANLGEKLTDEEVEEMIREADVDGDGQIDYSEFFQMMTSQKW